VCVGFARSQVVETQTLADLTQPTPLDTREDARGSFLELSTHQSANLTSLWQFIRHSELNNVYQTSRDALISLGLKKGFDVGVGHVPCKPLTSALV
jgi:hypothetical protein